MSYLALQTGPFVSPGSAELFLLARVLFGGVLAFMGLNHFTGLDDMAGYAGSKGVPAPRLAVAFTGGLLVLGGLSVGGVGHVGRPPGAPHSIHGPGKWVRKSNATAAYTMNSGGGVQFDVHHQRVLFF